jgi:hypothetical protein
MTTEDSAILYLSEILITPIWCDMLPKGLMSSFDKKIIAKIFFEQDQEDTTCFICNMCNAKLKSPKGYTNLLAHMISIHSTTSKRKQAGAICFESVYDEYVQQQKNSTAEPDLPLTKKKKASLQIGLVLL